MATNTLSVGAVADERSGNITVVAGTPVTVHLKSFTQDARVLVEKRDDTNSWQPTSTELDGAEPGRTLIGAGVYSLVRKSGTCGAFYD